jgi:hypothetical protein
MAVKERLERQSQPNRRELAVARLMEIARECAPLFPEGKSSTELMDELYDKETGLPI